MAIIIQLSRAVEAQLRERTVASGREVAEYAAQLLEEAIARPTLDEVLEPVRRDVAARGVTEQEVIALGRRELDALRRDRMANAT